MDDIGSEQRFFAAGHSKPILPAGDVRCGRKLAVESSVKRCVAAVDECSDGVSGMRHFGQIISQASDHRSRN
jgi:hypothetical protein